MQAAQGACVLSAVGACAWHGDGDKTDLTKKCTSAAGVAFFKSL